MTRKKRKIRKRKRKKINKKIFSQILNSLIKMSKMMTTIPKIHSKLPIRVLWEKNNFSCKALTNCYYKTKIIWKITWIWTMKILNKALYYQLNKYKRNQRKLNNKPNSSRKITLLRNQSWHSGNCSGKKKKKKTNLKISNR